MGIPSYNNSSTSSLIIAAGASLIAASIGLGYMAMTSSDNPNKDTNTSDAVVNKEAETSYALTTVTEIDDDDDDNNNENHTDVITEADVCKVFDQLYLELQNAFSQLMNQVQQLQMSGQRIPEQQLQMIMKQELERAIRTKQGPIIEMAGMDIDCFEEATWEFMKLNKNTVRVAVERMQKLWQTATGEQVVGWTPGSTPELVEPLGPNETIIAATKYFQALTECMRRLIHEYETQGKDLQNPTVQQQLNLDFGAQATEAGESALELLGYTQAQFEASVAANQSNPEVARTLTMLSMQQQQEFATMR